MYRPRFTLPAVSLIAVGLLFAGCGDDDTNDGTNNGAVDAPSETSATAAEFNEADVE